MNLGVRRIRLKLTTGCIVSILMLGIIAVTLSAVALDPVANAQSSVNVTINNFAFTPATITLVIGVNNTVTWTQEQSGVPYHTVTSDNGTWGSGHLTAGQTFTYTFTSPGTYGYHCTLHTYMKGTVIVLAAQETTSSSSSTTATASSASSVSTIVTSAATTSTSTSPSTSGAVPEFPFQAVAVVVITLIAVASYVALRRSRSA